MNNNLLFDFTVNKETKTVTIIREFAAPLSLVWDAFTIADMLDEWTAPKPFTAKTKYMNFVVGGQRFYAMISPEGQERWVVQEYLAIAPKTHFKLFNVFADKDENRDDYGSEWTYNFSQSNDITTVSISIYNESLERMERVIEMGFKEGFIMSIKNLEQLLTNKIQSQSN